MSQLIGIQHEKKHGKGSKNSSIYFDNKMIEEEEMEEQLDDDKYDECAYFKDEDDVYAYVFNAYAQPVLHLLQF